jgi:hypothetical protein
MQVTGPDDFDGEEWPGMEAAEFTRKATIGPHRESRDMFVVAH